MNAPPRVAALTEGDVAVLGSVLHFAADNLAQFKTYARDSVAAMPLSSATPEMVDEIPAAVLMAALRSLHARLTPQCPDVLGTS